MGPFPGGPPPSISVPSQSPPPPPGDAGGVGDDAKFKIIEDTLASLIKSEKDPEERAALIKIHGAVAQIQAGHQKQTDAMMGTSPAVKGLRRMQTQGGAY
jgi:hypothetical protein